MPLMQVEMVQQNGHFFTGHRCICSLPKKIPRISEGDYFPDRHTEQMEEISTKANLFSSWGLEHLAFPGLHSFSGADITGTVAWKGSWSFWKAFKDCDMGI